jgi:uncharacterized protein YeaO (DUF488 family)
VVGVGVVHAGGRDVVELVVRAGHAPRPGIRGSPTVDRVVNAVPSSSVERDTSRGGIIGVIVLARVHDPAESGNRLSFLVDRLWPRGIRRAALAGSQWLPDVGPSHELRKWFGHDPDKWDEFRRRYFAELDAHPEVWQPLVVAAVTGDITLLYNSSDPLHNNAVALRDYLRARLDEAEPL